MPGNPANRVSTDFGDDGFFEYVDLIPSQQVPYLYLSSYEGQGYQAADLEVYPNPDSRNMTNVYLQSDGTPWKQQSFQVISPGGNGQYGAGGPFDPNNNSALDTATHDNLTNFHSARLGS